MHGERPPASGEDVVPPAVRRRRADAIHARQRQLLMVDMGAAVVLAVLFIVLAPGLAIVAVGSLLVLAGCAVSLLYGRMRARGAARTRRRW